jgi:hypothetical protein
MRWNLAGQGKKEFFILCTHHNMSVLEGRSIVLDYSYGNWEVGLPTLPFLFSLSCQRSDHPFRYIMRC